MASALKVHPMRESADRFLLVIWENVGRFFVFKRPKGSHSELRAVEVNDTFQDSNESMVYYYGITIKSYHHYNTIYHFQLNGQKKPSPSCFSQKTS